MSYNELYIYICMYYCRTPIWGFPEMGVSDIDIHKWFIIKKIQKAREKGMI